MTEAQLPQTLRRLGGHASSVQLQQALNASQATVSRWLAPLVAGERVFLQSQRFACSMRMAHSSPTTTATTATSRCCCMTTAGNSRPLTTCSPCSTRPWQARWCHANGTSTHRTRTSTLWACGPPPKPWHAVFGCAPPLTSASALNSANWRSHTPHECAKSTLSQHRPSASTQRIPPFT